MALLREKNWSQSAWKVRSAL